VSATVKVKPRGPLVLEGDFTIRDAAGAVLRECQGGKVSLCRCGATRAAPFCDSSHNRIGFGAQAPGPDEEA